MRKTLLQSARQVKIQNKRSTAKDFNNEDIEQILSELPKGARTPLYKLLLDLNMTAEFLCILWFWYGAYWFLIIHWLLCFASI